MTDDSILFSFEIEDLIEESALQPDRFETYVKKKAEMIDCGECLGTGAEDYIMIEGKRMVIPCSFCQGTGQVKEKHYKNGIRIKYF